MNIQHSKLVSPKRQMWGYMLHSKTVTLFLDINYGSGLTLPPSHLFTLCDQALHVSPSLFPSCQKSRSLPNFANTSTQWPVNRFPRFSAQISQRFPRQGQIPLSSSTMVVEPVMELHQRVFAKLQLKRNHCLDKKGKKIRVKNIFLYALQFHDLLLLLQKEGNSQWLVKKRENCIIPISPASCPHPFTLLYYYVLSMFILYLDLVALLLYI